MPMMTPSLRWPEQLPLGLFIGRKYQTVNPLLRSTMVSGRARQRRQFTSTPVMVEVRWLMNSGDAQLFENWFQWALKDGTEWFVMPLKMPDGLLDREVRFTEIYDGPTEAGPGLWRFSASIEIRERQSGGDFEYILPLDMTNPEIFDLTMNREWPLA